MWFSERWRKLSRHKLAQFIRRCRREFLWIQHSGIAPVSRVRLADLCLRREQEIRDNFRPRAGGGVGRDRHKVYVADHPLLKTKAVAVCGQRFAGHFLPGVRRVKGDRQV